MTLCSPTLSRCCAAPCCCAAPSRAVPCCAVSCCAVPRSPMQIADTAGAFGRTIACGVAALPVEAMVPLFRGWAHMRSLFVLAALVLLGMGGTTVLALQEEPVKPQRAAQVHGAQASVAESASSVSMPSMEGRLSDRGKAALKLLWLSALLGRILVLVMSLYWTTWVGYSTLLPGSGIRLGCLGLAVQALACTLTSLVLEPIEARLEDFRIPLFGALVCTAASMSCLAAAGGAESPGVYMVLCLCSGGGHSVLMHSPRRITTRVLAAEDLLDQQSLYLGLVTSVTPIARVVLGLLSGVVLWLFFGAVSYTHLTLPTKRIV
eukprot:TRINITY_DN7558_c0_g3_i4.p1 TRINITY_DN7558_c0_g3~~TRINITY_DN7558_c0_g3_i4.p1  ORF type:complete len:320 (-),score=59.02 TRINITY_DN7558_c0_g3_i4:108-1067(-)